jgi:hypothetical protein
MYLGVCAHSLALLLTVAGYMPCHLRLVPSLAVPQCCTVQLMAAVITAIIIQTHVGVDFSWCLYAFEMYVSLDVVV